MDDPTPVPLLATVAGDSGSHPIRDRQTSDEGEDRIRASRALHVEEGFEDGEDLRTGRLR